MGQGQPRRHFGGRREATPTPLPRQSSQPAALREPGNQPHLPPIAGPSIPRPCASKLPEAYEETVRVGTRWQIRKRIFAHALPMQTGSPAGPRACSELDPRVGRAHLAAFARQLDGMAGSGDRYFQAAAAVTSAASSWTTPSTGPSSPSWSPSAGNEFRARTICVNVIGCSVR